MGASACDSSYLNPNTGSRGSAEKAPLHDCAASAGGGSVASDSSDDRDSTFEVSVAEEEMIVRSIADGTARLVDLTSPKKLRESRTASPAPSSSAVVCRLPQGEIVIR